MSTLPHSLGRPRFYNLFKVLVPRTDRLLPVSYDPRGLSFSSEDPTDFCFQRCDPHFHRIRRSKSGLLQDPIIPLSFPHPLPYPLSKVTEFFESRPEHY